MSYVLDPNTVSAFTRGDTPVLERLRRASKADASVPQPVLAEISYSIERLPRSRRKARLRQRFELIRAEFLSISLALGLPSAPRENPRCLNRKTRHGR